MDCTFSVHVTNNTVCLKKKIDDKITWLDVEVPLEDVNQRIMEYVNTQILCFLKPVFYLMPMENINSVFTPEASGKLGNLLTNYNVFLKQTNEVAKQIKKTKINTSDFENILFFETDKNSLYTDFFHRISKKTDKEVFIEYLETGFNAEKRRWEKAELPFLIPELVEYLIQNRIKI
ncbi:hypothetical protein QUF70_07315, partial [Desulfobacterales bacterium HSG17]|nr:hypothetical protein [Desulfobacterales bacterium HSG17]